MKSTEFDAPSTEVTGAASEKDKRLWQELDSLLEKFPHSPAHLMLHWPVYSRRVSIMRFLAHFKLFEMTQHLPGDIVEIGVGRGLSLFTWHKFLEVFHPTDTYKKVIGIDWFEGLSSFSGKDGALDPVVGKHEGGWSTPTVGDEIEQLVAWHNSDNILARERIILKRGKVEEVLGPFLESRPGMRISLLHMDVDLYDPTLFALRHLWDLVVPGGVVVLDEYGLPPWAGESNAVDQFLNERGIRDVRIQKFPWSLTPNGYIVKPG